jgi:hypothetical protein
MRAKEFIIEATEAGINNPDQVDGHGKTLAQIEKTSKKTQPHKAYKPKTFKNGKLGVPAGVEAHDTHSQHQSNTEYGSKRGELSDEANAAMPGAFSVETLPSDFYGIYRLGMGLAAGDRNIAAADNIGKHPFFMPFAPEEHARFDKEIKRQGHKTKLRTTKDSLELSTVNQISPVNKPKPNKYGI